MNVRTRFADGQAVPAALSAVQPFTACITVMSCPCCTNAFPNRLPNDPDTGMNPGTGRRVTLPFALEYVVPDTHDSLSVRIGVISSSSSVPWLTIWPPLLAFVANPVEGATESVSIRLSDCFLTEDRLRLHNIL